MVGGYWKGIVISALFVTSIIYYAMSKKNFYNVDKAVDTILRAEKQIRKKDHRVSVMQQETSDENIKCFYMTIIDAGGRQCSVVRLNAAEIKYVFEMFQLRLNEYETEELFEAVRKAAEELEKHEEKMRQIENVQNTMEFNSCDLQTLGSINFTELQSSHDKDSFALIFRDELEKLRYLRMKTSPIESSAALETLVANFDEEIKNITENEFDEFKENSITVLSDFVIRIEKELQHSKSATIQYLNENPVFEESEQLAVRFRIAIVKAFQKITDEYLIQTGNA